jgi:hypothetical protein
MEFSRSNRERYYRLPLSELLTVIPALPQYQRIIDKGRVNEIYEKIKKVIESGEEPFLPGCLIIVKSKNKKWLLDGNHRFQIYKKLYDKCKFDCNIVCNEIEVKTDEEAKALFKIINNVVPIPDMPEGIDLTSVHMIAKYFLDKYPRIFSNSRSRRCFRPHLHRDSFQEKVGQLLGLLEKKGPVDNTEIIRKIEEYNDTLKTKNWKFFVSSGHDTSVSIMNHMTKARQKGGLYVGMFNSYKWLFHLFGIYNITNRFHYVKKKIPKALRIAVWNRYMGGNARKGLCPICRDRELRIEDFHCGHDLAEAKGGGMNVDNLFPICALCNQSMGTKNFYKAWQELQTKQLKKSE